MNTRENRNETSAEKKPTHVDAHVWDNIQHYTWIELVDLIDDLTEANRCLTTLVRRLRSENQWLRERLWG